MASLSVPIYDQPLAGDSPDPFALTFGGAYYVMATRYDHLELMKLHGDLCDPQAWEQANRRVLWRPSSGGCPARDIWAPELHAVEGRWHVYFAGNTADGEDRNRRMYVLRGPSADTDPLQGDWEFAGPLRLPESRYAIDGTVLTPAPGEHYFIWSSKRDVSDGWYQHLMIARMRDPLTLADEEFVISAPTEAWERHDHPVNEGPQVMLRGGDIWVGYSASAYWTPHYAIGFLRARLGTDLLDPASWTKYPHPFFQQIPGQKIYGPGHASFAPDLSCPDQAEWLMLYHARDVPDALIAAPRRPHVRPVQWVGDLPVLMEECVFHGVPVS